MNRYLLKVAASLVNSDAAYLNREYDRLVAATGAKTIETGNPLNKKYWDAAWGGGGNYMLWDTKKDPQGNTQPVYTLVHAKPNILTRAISQVHSIIEPRAVTDTMYALGKVHEGIEADEHMRHEFPLWKDIVEGLPGSKLTPEPINGHTSAAVLMRESNMVNTLKNPSLVSKNSRYRYGIEDRLLYDICKKVYGEHFTEADIDKARHFHYKTIDYEA